MKTDLFPNPPCQPFETSRNGSGRHSTTSDRGHSPSSNLFRPEALPEDYVEAILRLAAQAPSGGDREPWRFVVVRDPEGQKRLRRAVADNDTLGEAPLYVVAFEWYGDGRMGIEDGISEEGDFPDREASNGRHRRDHSLVSDRGSAPTAVWVDRQVMTATTTMMLVAKAFGVESSAMPAFDPEAVKRQVGLPPEARVVALLALGFPTAAQESADSEPSLEEIVHCERYGRRWSPEAR